MRYLAVRRSLLSPPPSLRLLVPPTARLPNYAARMFFFSSSPAHAGKGAWFDSESVGRCAGGAAIPRQNTSTSFLPALLANSFFSPYSSFSPLVFLVVGPGGFLLISYYLLPKAMLLCEPKPRVRGKQARDGCSERLILSSCYGFRWVYQAYLVL